MLRTRNLPRSWEREVTFHESLYQWMEHAPWLGISCLAHLMAILLLAIMPWSLFERSEEVILQVAPLAPEEEVFQVEPDEVPPEVEPIDEAVDPHLVDAELPDSVDPVLDDWNEAPEGDPDFLTSTPFENLAWNSDLGVGGGGGGHYGTRWSDGSGARPGGAGTEDSLRVGIKWLVDHQDADGKWDADGFSKHDPVLDRTQGSGDSEHDVGVTALALLALLGDGHTTRRGLYRDSVARGVQWLRTRQDPESGLFGEASGHSFVYDHAIASLAMCEAYYFSGSPLLKGTAQRAINFITRARSPYGVWRYAVPPDNTGDSSVTGWMVFALQSAEEAGLQVDSAAFADSIAWFDEVTEPSTGRVGYDARGTASARVTGVNDEFPTGGVEAMTAVGLLSRFFLGQNPAEEPLMKKHAELLLRSLPEWSEDGLTNDMYYWYYGSYAMFQMGGRYWRSWNKAMKRAVLETQRKDGAAKGSWDPNGPWGSAGGRVYSTATMSLCLEVYFRYSRVLGAR
ncbi:MAG: hypothetical protein ABGY71_11745 [bacterium]|jgi:hypothetical protein